MTIKTKTLRWLAAMLLLVSAMVIPARGNAQVTLTYVSGSSGFNGETAENLFDGKTGTKWCGPCNNESPAYVIFKASEPCWLNGYTITTANDTKDYSGRNPKDWKIYGSNDRNTWTELVTVSNDDKLQGENYTPYEYTHANAIDTPYIYYKWEITATKGDINVQVSEFSISATDWKWVPANGLQGGAFEYKYKVAILPNNIDLVNIQKPDWDSEAGFYIRFPSDVAFGAIRINGVQTKNYAVDGAGVCLHLSNFTADLTEVQVMDPENTETTKWTLYVYYVKPVMGSASEAYVTPNAAVLIVAGTENGNGDPVTRFKVVYGGKTNIYTARNEQIIITGLNPNTTYKFDISAVDAVGKESDNMITVPVTTLKSHPDAPADPTHAQDKVFSIYSDTYTSKVNRVFGSWNQTTVEEEVDLADNVRKAYYYTNCNFLGWELNNNKAIGDMSHFPKLHMDIYVHEKGSIKFSPVCWVNKEENKKKEELKEYSLKQGWNALDIDLTKDFTTTDLQNIFQLKWDAMPAVCYIDNVYFWAEVFIIYHHGDMPEKPEYGAVETFPGGEILYPIQYKRMLTPGKWETLCLPFTVNSITVYDPYDKKDYELYAQYRNGGKVIEGEFWLRQFVKSSVTAAEFQNNWQDIEANSREEALPKIGVPYIIRVPKDEYGYYNDKYIVFHGAGGQEIAKTNDAPSVPADGYFSYSGNQTMKDWELKSAYVLDVEREAFEAADANRSVIVHPFECAVNATQATISRCPRLMISSRQITTADGLPSTEYEGGRIYTTMGVLVGTFETLDEEENCVMHLPEGIYIVQRRQAISKIHISK